MKKKEIKKPIVKKEEKIDDGIKEIKEEIKKEEKLPNYLSYNEMTEQQMDAYLFELSKTAYWQAILKLTYNRDGEILKTLAVIDAFKEPNLVSRAQGERTGIYNLNYKIDMLINNIAELNKTPQEKAKDENKTPGYGKW